MLTLLSTVVAPVFSDGELIITSVRITSELLIQVERNLCGHPATNEILRAICPELPPQEKAFWDGSTTGLAIRPKGGVRGAAQTGDIQVGLDDLEAVIVYWRPLY